MNSGLAEILVNLKDIAVGLSIISNSKFISMEARMNADRMLLDTLKIIDDNLKK